MNKQLSDAEVWAEIAAQIEGANYIRSGLCGYIGGLCMEYVIPVPQADRLKQQLRKKYGHLCGMDGYYWPHGAVAPRIVACRQLAKEAAAKR